MHLCNFSGIWIMYVAQIHKDMYVIAVIGLSETVTSVFFKPWISNNFLTFRLQVCLALEKPK